MTSAAAYRTSPLQRRPRPTGAELANLDAAIDVWRSFGERVRGFTPRSDVEFGRIAVTPEQIATLNLPTRRTKASDSRAANFARESVEVNAIPLRVLRQLAEECIARHVDERALRLTEAVEQSERDVLAALVGAAR